MRDSQDGELPHCRVESARWRTANRLVKENGIATLKLVTDIPLVVGLVDGVEEYLLYR